VVNVPSRRSSTDQRQAITADRIAHAALDLVRESGYAAVNMRSVAERLGTGQASLYAHVRGKADLERLMVETVAAEIDRPSTGSWREDLESEAARTQEVYARYPGLAVAAFASLPRAEGYVDRLEARLELLQSAGLEPRQAQAADVAVGLLAIVRSIEDAQIAARITESGLTAEEWWQHARDVVTEDPHARPLVAQMGEHLTPRDRAWMSRELIQIVLDGIQARYGPKPQRSRGRSAHDDPSGQARRTQDDTQRGR
jgi:AcrR family transcriptional regulator